MPKEFKDYEDAFAHVRITLEISEDKKAKKERLFAAFKKAQKAGLFAEIEDPVEWQRELRNEWD